MTPNPHREAGAALPIVALLREEAQFATGVHVLDHGLMERAADTIESLVEVLEDAVAYIRGDIQGPSQRDGILREIDALLAKLEAGDR
jgi:hypothetical protein